jgi:hypothetical protein
VEGKLSAAEAGARGGGRRLPWPLRLLLAYGVTGVVVVLVVDFIALFRDGGSMFNTYAIWYAAFTQPSPNPLWIVIPNLILFFVLAVAGWPYYLYMFVAGIKFFERG